MKKLYSVTILEADNTIIDCYTETREKALQKTNAAENIRNCKAWRITYTRNEKVIHNNQTNQNEKL